MSVNDGHDKMQQDACSTDKIVISSSSSPKIAIIPPEPSSSPYLDVPAHRPRRSSIDSTFSGSDLSELTFAAESLHDDGAPLLHSVSADSVQATTLKGRLQHSISNFWTANYGAVLVMLAQFFGALMNLCTTLLEHSSSSRGGMHPFQILFVRQTITASLCITWALYSKSIPDFPLGPKDTKIRLLLVTRGMSGFLGVFGMYYSLLYLPLAEATVLTFLAPILTCYLCAFVLPGESGGFGRQQQIAGFVSLIGVVFIAQPAALFKGSSGTSHGATDSTNSTSADGAFDAPPMPSGQHNPTPSQHLNAILCSLLGVLGATGAMTSIRAIGTRAHPFVSINYFSVWCSIVSLMCLLIFPSVSFRLPADAHEWGLLAGLGACGFTMQWLLTAGLAYGSSASSPNMQSQLDNPNDLEYASGAAQMSLRPSKEAKKQKRMRGSGTRATSMVYTQMLFALAIDKWVFGVSPSAWSWTGSTFILSGACWVAVAKSKGGKGMEKDNAVEMGSGVERRSQSDARAKEEAAALMSGGTVEEGEDHQQEQSTRQEHHRASEHRIDDDQD